MTEIRTASELDALPVGSVLRLAGGLVADKIHHDGDRVPKWGICGYFGPQPIRDADLPATVLFRPDAPQPATGDDAVERAARAWTESGPTPAVWANVSPHLQTAIRSRMAVALAAARAGEADGPDWSDWHSHGYADGYLAAQRGGEAVDREVLREAFRRWVRDGRSCNAGEALAQELAEVARVALAARGDTATPTEVEWGVRYIDPQGEVHDSLRHDEVAARLSVEVDPSVTLVQRDVHRSAWREVEGGEQRG